MMQRRDIQVRQGAVDFTNRSGVPKTMPFIAKVENVYSDRMTCDLITNDGQKILNVPVMTKSGLKDGKPYGEVDLPEIEDFVIVMYASYGTRHKVIIGTFIPYLAKEFKDAAPVNSDNKQFATTFMELDIPDEYRRIFKSGTSIQVGEDGTITVETPSGAYVLFDEANGEIKLEDPHGNIYLMDSSGVNLTDANGNELSMESGKVVINGNLEVSQ
jgi:hypothetical protein